MKLIYNRIFDKLERIGILTIEGSKHLKAAGFMDLVVEKLGENHYSLTHYYEQGGDLCPDPDMEIRIIPEMRAAEALTFQDTFGFRRVYPQPGYVDVKAKKELNAFLLQWLSNLIAQGFRNEA